MSVDQVAALTEEHLRRILRSYARYYNSSRKVGIAHRDDYRRIRRRSSALLSLRQGRRSRKTRSPSKHECSAQINDECTNIASEPNCTPNNSAGRSGLNGPRIARGPRSARQTLDIHRRSELQFMPYDGTFHV